MVIAAFRATLEEINEAAVLIHVVDITHPNAAEQTETVNKVLEEIGADGKPVLMALNKIDLLQDDAEATLLDFREHSELPADVVAISAQAKLGLDDLMATVERLLDVEQDFVSVTMMAPYDRYDLVDRFHRLGRVDLMDFTEEGATVHGQLPSSLVGRFEPFLAVHTDRHAGAA